MTANVNLRNAKAVKNDEFYTQLADILDELKYYRQHFVGATVLCNCDNPKFSNFWRYFHLNFERLGLKRLISTHYDKNKPTFIMTYDGGNDIVASYGTITYLTGNGDFRSQECLDLLDTCDIVATNPPFSLAREYMNTLVTHNKKFLIIGDLNWITYKEIFPMLKNNQIWLGYNPVKAFIQPDGSIKKFGNKLWYTNLDIPKRHKNLVLRKHYDPKTYAEYNNYSAINIDKVSDIPVDYPDTMGVPITFLNKYNPDQFEITSFCESDKYVVPCSTAEYGLITGAKQTICSDGKSRYARIAIRRK